MRRNILYILLFFVGCTSANSKRETFVIQDLDIDFPTTDTLACSATPKQTFEILSTIGSFCVKDSVLFVEEWNADNIGHCYSLKNGKELSTILGRGNAVNELNTDYTVYIRLVGDLIQITDPNNRIIKTFATNDVVTKPMGERDFSVMKLPDSICSVLFRKTDDHTIIIANQNEFDDRNLEYLIYDGKEVSFFGEMRKEFFNSTKEVTNLEMRHLVIPFFASNGVRVVAVDQSGIRLQVLDVSKKAITAERCYEPIICEVTENVNFSAFMLNTYKVYDIRCTEKYIFCFIGKKNPQKSEESGRAIYDRFTLVFDWDLNPVKKYYFQFPKKAKFYLSEDAETFYFLTSEDEKQELFEGTFTKPN